MKFYSVFFSSLFAIMACASELPNSPLDDYIEIDATTNLDAPDVDVATVVPENRDVVRRGEYLIELLGCGSCHTDGALVGVPKKGRSLAGSSIGIAYTNPLKTDRPGIVFPPNITPDDDTGIGLWSDRQIMDAIRVGQGRHGTRRILVMPWQSYAAISGDDIWAIIGYLRSVKPVVHRVPEDVPLGSKARDPYVHFGVYRTRE